MEPAHNYMQSFSAGLQQPANNPADGANLQPLPVQLRVVMLRHDLHALPLPVRANGCHNAGLVGPVLGAVLPEEPLPPEFNEQAQQHLQAGQGRHKSGGLLLLHHRHTGPVPQRVYLWVCGGARRLSVSVSGGASLQPKVLLLWLFLRDFYAGVQSHHHHAVLCLPGGRQGADAFLYGDVRHAPLLYSQEGRRLGQKTYTRRFDQR